MVSARHCLRLCRLQAKSNRIEKPARRNRVPAGRDIRSFQEKITVLEEQVEKLKEMEKQVEKDLKEVTELQKEKKNAVVPAKKKSSQVRKQTEVVFGKIPSLWNIKFPFWSRKAAPVNRMHSDLMDLQKNAFQREQNLKELRGIPSESKIGPFGDSFPLAGDRGALARFLENPAPLLRVKLEPTRASISARPRGRRLWPRPTGSFLSQAPNRNTAG